MHLRFACEFRRSLGLPGQKRVLSGLRARSGSFQIGVGLDGSGSEPADESDHA